MTTTRLAVAPWLAAALLTCATPRTHAAIPDTTSAAILAVGSAERLDPRQFRLSVTFVNCGAELDRDYRAFLHFDRSERSERLYFRPEPGPRPLVAPTGSGSWGPNDEQTVTFGTVTLPAPGRHEVFLKAGLYDAAGDGHRLPLAGGDPSRRALLGRFSPDESGWTFVRTPPGAFSAEEPRVGVRPRALVRAMPDPPAVRFGEVDLSRWALTCFGKARAAAARTREELCWSEASLEIEYAGAGHGSGFVIRPPAPVPVPASADVARLWLLGRAHGWSKTRTDEEPLLKHYLEFRDGEGQARRIDFRPRVAYPFWYVARRRIPAEWARPLLWTGAGFVGCTNRRPRTLLLDALVFARERLASDLATSVRLDDLPMPKDSEGLLPSLAIDKFENSVLQAEGGYVLRYEGEDGLLVYRLVPRAGTLDDVEAVWQAPGDAAARTAFTLAADSGPVVELGGRRYAPTSAALSRVCRGVHLSDGKVRTEWRCEAGDQAADYSMDFAIRGKSLLVDVRSEGRKLAAFSPGCLDAPGGARFVHVPYWTWLSWDWGRDGGVAVVGGLFVSGTVDWYRSGATRISFGPPVLSHRVSALRDSRVCYAPGVVYEPCTDGRRNPLRERFVFTASPNVLETLPNIPHPPSPNAVKLAPYAHSTGGQASRLAEQLEHWRRLHAYGVNRVYIRHFDGMWSDSPQGTQEWTLTEHAAPLVGDVAMREYLATLTSMGFLPVLYTNYTDLQPVAAAFDWDLVKRRSDGDISDACWPGSYPLKPLRAVELQEKYAPRIAARFGTKGSFCDVHTAAPPWGKVDFDSRLPGAGSFGTTYRCYAKLLMNERAVYGAVYSEGSCHWLYAGLHDGSDAQLRGRAPWREPFLVDFDLLKIHPKQMDAGMSWISRYVTTPEEEEALGGSEPAQDRFVAATLAFGHQATFTGRRFRGYSTDVRTYCMLQPLQLLYAMREAEEITYHDPARPGTFLDTSAAIRSSVYEESQVRVRYDSGLQVHVNGSLTEPWQVQGRGDVMHELPPSGFACWEPGEVLVFSAVVNGSRMDYARTADMRFVDARGAKNRIGGFETDGAALARRTGPTAWRVWPLGNTYTLVIDPRELGMRTPLRVSGRDAEEVELGQSGWEPGDAALTLRPAGEVFRYDLAPVE